MPSSLRLTFETENPDEPTVNETAIFVEFDKPSEVPSEEGMLPNSTT
jgi:hypothetical protein